MGKFFQELDTFEFIAILALAAVVLYYVYQIGSGISGFGSGIVNWFSSGISDFWNTPNAGQGTTGNDDSAPGMGP